MTLYRFFATTAGGLEPVLFQELKRLHPHSLRQSHGGVFFEGDLALGLQANLWLRTAHRILLPLVEFPCPDLEALYAGALEVDWADWLTPRHTLAVEATVSRSAINHSRMAALKIKDGVVDALRQRYGQRPDVHPTDPDVRLQAMIHQDRCQLSVDLSGDPLFKRGYRRNHGEAPLKETLAAAILLFAGYDGSVPLWDPFCGSGTLAIEAALLARNHAPGLHRGFGFERHPWFGQEEARLWAQLQEEARAQILPRGMAPIQASDRDEEVLAQARGNLRSAGVSQDVSLVSLDARDMSPWEPGAALISNLPYGHRLGGGSQSVLSLYRLMGVRLKQFPDGEAWFLSGHPGLEGGLSMPPRARIRLHNGPLEVWLYGYQLGPQRRRR